MSTPAWMGPVLHPHDCEERGCASSPYKAGPYHDYTDETKERILAMVDSMSRPSAPEVGRRPRFGDAVVVMLGSTVAGAMLEAINAKETGTNGGMVLVLAIVFAVALVLVVTFRLGRSTAQSDERVTPPS